MVGRRPHQHPRTAWIAFVDPAANDPEPLLLGEVAQHRLEIVGWQHDVAIELGQVGERVPVTVVEAEVEGSVRPSGLVAVPFVDGESRRGANHTHPGQLGRQPVKDLGGPVGRLVVDDEPQVGLARLALQPAGDLLDVTGLVADRRHEEDPRAVAAHAAAAARAATARAIRSTSASLRCGCIGSDSCRSARPSATGNSPWRSP